MFLVRYPRLRVAAVTAVSTMLVVAGPAPGSLAATGTSSVPYGAVEFTLTTAAVSWWGRALDPANYQQPLTVSYAIDGHVKETFIAPLYPAGFSRTWTEGLSFGPGQHTISVRAADPLDPAGAVIGSFTFIAVPGGLAASRCDPTYTRNPYSTAYTPNRNTKAVPVCYWSIGTEEALDKTFQADEKRIISTAPAPRASKWSAQFGAAFAQRAAAWVGLPYTYDGGNGSGPSRGVDFFGDGGGGEESSQIWGFDCSGLVQWALAPWRSVAHYSGSQYSQAGRLHPSLSGLLPGDLIFWGSGAGHHVAVYIGNGDIVQAWQSGWPVDIGPLTDLIHGTGPFTGRAMGQPYGATRPLTSPAEIPVEAPKSTRPWSVLALTGLWVPAVFARFPLAAGLPVVGWSRGGLMVRVRSGVGYLVAALVVSGVAVVSAPAASASSGVSHVSAVPSVAGAFVSVSPTRMLDTITGTGVSHAGPVAANSSVSLLVEGVGPIPVSGVSAIVANVTAAGGSAAGNLRVYADGSAVPNASNVNFTAGQTVPNLVVAPVGSDGKVDFFNSSAGHTQVIADVAGYFVAGTASVAGAFTSLNPTRMLDTITGTGVAAAGPVGAGGTAVLQVEGVGSIPGSDVSAVVANVTAAGATAAGNLRVHADGTAVPNASNVNFLPGQTVPNLVVAPVGEDGKVDFFNSSTGSTQVIADVTGYFLGGTPTDPGTFVSTAPTRQLDTINGTGVSHAGAVAANSSVSFATAGVAPVPASGVAAVVANVTVALPTAAGNLRVYADGSPVPYASNLNFLAHQTVPNLDFAPVGADGKVAIYNSSPGTSQIIADISGYFLGTPAYPTVTGLVASPAVTSTHLTWTNPTIAGLAGVMIRRTNGATPPVSITDGTLVTTVTPPGTSYTDTGLTAGTQYSYSLFAFDSTPNYSVPVSVTTTTLTTASTGTATGTVTAAGTTTGLGNVTVDVYKSGTVIATGTTNSAGTYSITGLAPSTTDDVCFDGAAATGGSSQAGYLDQCSSNVAWTGGTLPTGLTPVAVTAGATTSGVNAALPPVGFGTISGTVTAASGGAPLAGVTVLLFETSDGQTATTVASATTDSSGNYKISNIAPMSLAYAICFVGSAASGGTSTTGYQGQCQGGVAWDPTQTVPDAVHFASLGAGQAITGIDGSLSTGVAVSGTVTAAVGGAALAGVKVIVYSVVPNVGAFEIPGATAMTNSSGQYQVNGLTASTSGFDVCFDASKANGGSSTTGYLDQCYQNQPWDGVSSVPTAATPVGGSNTGGLTTGIDAALGTGGAISGTVTAAAGAAGVGGVQVQLWSSGGFFLADTTTSGTGAYSFTGLPATSGDAVCFDTDGVSAGTSG